MTEKQQKTMLLHAFFKQVWDDRENDQGICYCASTGKELKGTHYRSLTTCFHHMYPKNKYPELAMDENNIVILHPDVHTEVEHDEDKHPKIKKLKEKYGRTIETGIYE